MPSPTTGVLDALANGSLTVVDLTQPLRESTPVVVLPEPFANTPHRSHFDAPIHRISAQDGKDVASVAPRRLVGPAIVIDRSEACAADPGHLLTVADLEAFEAEHGRIPEGAWVLFRSGCAGAQDEERFLDVGPDGPVTPGPDVDAARWLGNDRHGLTQLANVGQLPPTGAVIVVAPLKLVGGTGSPSRVLALVPA
jgi:kynurenine formamidase